MNRATVKPIAKGLLKRLSILKSGYISGGNTLKGRYCYSVWMRHLMYWNAFKNGVPKIVAELGPGNSLGIGFCALLSGSEQIHSLEVVKYWDKEKNLQTFNELVDLFKQRTAIPGKAEFPRVIPSIEDYGFPSDLLTETILDTALNENRLNAIRAEIMDLDNPNNTFIKCHVPWYETEIMEKGTVDFIYSQSVLQYIDYIDGTFSAMKAWLKPQGVMSHSIDLSSIGVTNSWDSHWTCSDFEWDLIKTGQDFIVRRRPYSSYEQLHAEHDFTILKTIPIERKNTIKRNQLSKRFKNLSDSDFKTAQAYMISQAE